jgi:hypothetical protein
MSLKAGYWPVFDKIIKKISQKHEIPSRNNVQREFGRHINIKLNHIV